MSPFTPPTGEAAPDRRVLRIAGRDARAFLQDLVTNDVAGLASGAVYAALLTPQGKYLADFIMLAEGEAVLLDVARALAAPLARRLAIYRLRAAVEIAETGRHVWRGLGPAPAGAFADPRHPALGWRRYADTPGSTPTPAIDWDAIRVAHCIPESGIELIPDDSYILEAGFERLHGVDFRKGCYVGQEVTARMKHKTALRKGLAIVTLDGPAEPGTPIERDGREVGRLHTRAGDRAIAFLRFERAGPGMIAAAARVNLPDPA